MANDQRARDWAIARALEYTWYLWEDNSPPSSHGFFNVMMPGGEELTALFDRRGTWWSIRMERIVPMFWRDSSHLPH